MSAPVCIFFLGEGKGEGGMLLDTTSFEIRCPKKENHDLQIYSVTLLSIDICQYNVHTTIRIRYLFNVHTVELLTSSACIHTDNIVRLYSKSMRARLQ